MYATVAKWEQALRIAQQYLPEDDRIDLYLKQGQKF
jgi:hypothetical protein